jgi:hypothetical protein
MIVIPHPFYSLDLAPCNFSLFPQLKERHFDTVEVMKRTTSRVMVASRSKISFDQMAAPVLEIMDTD